MIVTILDFSEWCATEPSFNIDDIQSGSEFVIVNIGHMVFRRPGVERFLWTVDERSGHEKLTEHHFRLLCSEIYLKFCFVLFILYKKFVDRIINMI